MIWGVFNYLQNKSISTTENIRNLELIREQL